MHQWLSANRANFFPIFAYLDTPISLSQWLLLKHGEWDQLATRWLDPQWYPEGVFSSLKFRKDVMSVDLLRKYPMKTTFSRKEAAYAAWEAAEDQCYWTNERLIRMRSIRTSPEERRLQDFLGRVKIRMTRWMGRLPDDLIGGFGPGTCVEYKESNPTVMDKLWLTPSTTPAAAPYFSEFFGRTHWGISRLQAGLDLPAVSRGNRFTTVPKDGKTERPISIEPLGNLWLQLGVGRFLKKRLRTIGLPRFIGTHKEIFPGLDVVYPDAQETHRALAREGCSGKWATIDLSSASDTISLELVRAICPDDWFEVLNDFRSRLTWVPYLGNERKVKGRGRWRHLEKFSSMGNGFTFELETMIFLALICEAFSLVPGVDCWVFGDDIILPAQYGESCYNLLSQCGFTPNRRKSYHQGPFRESCGGHYHSGVDVNPVKLKESPDSVPAILSLHNALVKWGIPTSCLKWLVAMIPRRCRIAGPKEAGDVVLHGYPYKSRRSNGWDYVQTLRFEPENVVSLERWTPELSITGILLGVPPRLVRRGTHVKVSSKRGHHSVS